MFKKVNLSQIRKNKMKKKVIVVSVTILLIGIFLIWCFDILNKPVETIDGLIGKNFDYARVTYFKTNPDIQYNININQNLNEFDGAILNSKNLLSDSVVNVYTWTYFNHKKTIWVGQTSKMQNQIIDAIRYKNNIRF
jgi:hypothetical protein